MANRAVISKDQILDIAYDMAGEQGLSSLGIREVARACNVSVGTVYNSYGTKADLFGDVIERFWNHVIATCMPPAAPNQNFVDFCDQLASSLATGLVSLHGNWLEEMDKVSAADLATARVREQECFEGVIAKLETVLRSDPDANLGQLEKSVTPTQLCAFAWDNVLESIKRGKPGCETLFYLLRSALY